MLASTLGSACGHACGAELGSLICGWELLCTSVAHSPRSSVPIPQVGVDKPWWDQMEPNWMGRASRVRCALVLGSEFSPFQNQNTKQIHGEQLLFLFEYF